MAPVPPKLPPRQPAPRDRSTSPSATSQASVSSELSRPRADTVHLTPYGRQRSQSPGSKTNAPSEPPPPYEERWSKGEDPRSSSMHSLLPVESVNETRRRLLLVYIHGFLGNETSFKSFPAHVHNILTVTLAETHTVHTKIYPRYKSRGAIDFARDDFSNWLYPNEAPKTDIVLLGHSLGGILAAEVALLPSHVPRSPEIYQHRILGVIAFDTPFLGMHPGVISSGLGSLFRPAPELPESRSPDDNSLSPVPSGSGSVLSPSDSVRSDPFSTVPTGPYYNASFANDVIWNPSKSCWESSLHFVQKHSDGLFKASKQYVKSHLEFGGCLADYPGLRRRYDLMRGLEDVDELAHRRDQQGRPLRQVRFVNYYSASTGRPKVPKQDRLTSEEPIKGTSVEMKDMSLHPPGAPDGPANAGTATSSPRLSLEEHTDDGLVPKPLDEMDPHPMSYSDDERHESDLQLKATADELDQTAGIEKGSIDNKASAEDLTSLAETPTNDALSPIPPLPNSPPAFDPSKYTAKDTLKIAEKEHARQVKAYERAKKDREKTIRDREKMVKKREKTLAKEAEKQAKMEKKKRDIEGKERLKRSATVNPETYDKQVRRDVEDTGMSEEQVRKKQRDRKFCVLPAKDPKTGLRDSTWIRVYMEGVDEVVAHTTLFFDGAEHYEKLVGDTATRIEDWVHTDGTKRLVLAEEANMG